MLVLEIKGLNKENIISISNHKGEDSWVKDYRLEAYKQFESMSDKLPFGPDFKLDFDKITYYKSQDDTLRNDWNQVLKPVKEELENLGVLESEQHMGGMGVQYESEVIYH